VEEGGPFQPPPPLRIGLTNPSNHQTQNCFKSQQVVFFYVVSVAAVRETRSAVQERRRGVK
jgi:hypothetical protein